MSRRKEKCRKEGVAYIPLPNGRPPKVDKLVSVSVKFHPEHKAALERIAQAKQTTVAAVIRGTVQRRLSMVQAKIIGHTIDKTKIYINHVQDGETYELMFPAPKAGWKIGDDIEVPQWEIDEKVDRQKKGRETAAEAEREWANAHAFSPFETELYKHVQGPRFRAIVRIQKSFNAYTRDANYIMTNHANDPKLVKIAKHLYSESDRKQTALGKALEKLGLPNLVDHDWFYIEDYADERPEWTSEQLIEMGYYSSEFEK